MTIEKGEPWGSVATTPFNVVTAPNEEATARAVRGGATHVALLSGDLLRALGSVPTGRRLVTGQPCLQLPCDLLQVTIDDDLRTCAVGSVRIGSTLRPRAWLTTGGFLGPLNVAPRAHPNDGVLDVLEFAPGIGVRQLASIRRRMRLGDHLPHPLLTVRRGADYEWKASEIGLHRASLTIDGRRFGRVATVRVVVQPDAFFLCVPLDPAG